MTVIDKIRAKAGLTLGLAACLTLGGALAVALSGGLSAMAEGRSKTIAQLETSQQTAPDENPPAGDTQSPVEAAPEDPGTTPDTGDTQAPARQEDNQQTPQPTETLPPGPGDTQGPNTAPDIQNNQTPEPTESPAPETTDTSQESETRTENIVFVSTTEGSVTSEIEGESERFSQIVGSGRLLVNEDDQVTGYYFTVTGLGPSQTLPYHFHSSKSGSTPTSCEGDKGVLEDEAAGAVITSLSEIAPLQSTASGLGVVGSASSPVQLPNPVPLEEIGYLNIHATEDPTSGIVCANVPLKPVKFESSAQPVAPVPSPEPSPESSPVPSPEPSPMPSPESDQNPPTQGPNTAPVPPVQDNQSPEPSPESSPPTMEPLPESEQNPPTQGPNTAPVPPTMNN